MGKHLMWDVTVVDALGPFRMNEFSLWISGTTVTETEARQIEKYRELIDKEYLSELVILEKKGWDESSETFITRLC